MSAAKTRTATDDVLELAELRQTNAQRARIVKETSAKLGEILEKLRAASLDQIGSLAAEVHSLSDVIRQTTEETHRDAARIRALERRLQ
jgi:hypothetical protein